MYIYDLHPPPFLPCRIDQRSAYSVFFTESLCGESQLHTFLLEKWGMQCVEEGQEDAISCHILMTEAV